MNWQILIVDDASAAREQLRSALEARGARVVEAENGSEGLWRARENQIDLFLIDVHMPVMGGLRMVEELRKLPQYATAPIFVLTSDAGSARFEEGKAVGASAWILKPIRMEVLWKAIDRALFGKAGSPGAAELVPGTPAGTGSK